MRSTTLCALKTGWTMFHSTRLKHFILNQFIFLLFLVGLHQAEGAATEMASLNWKPFVYGGMASIVAEFGQCAAPVSFCRMICVYFTMSVHQNRDWNRIWSWSHSWRHLKPGDICNSILNWLCSCAKMTTGWLLMDPNIQKKWIYQLSVCLEHWLQILQWINIIYKIYKHLISLKGSKLVRHQGITI